MAERILSARVCRTFYNVADALVPSGPDPGAGDVDLVPLVERALRGQGVGAVRRTWVLLIALEWWPMLTLRARRGFSSAPLERRRAVLDRWRRSRLRTRREALRDLEARVREALDEHAKLRAQVCDLVDQSDAGA